MQLSKYCANTTHFFKSNPLYLLLGLICSADLFLFRRLFKAKPYASGTLRRNSLEPLALRYELDKLICQGKVSINGMALYTLL
jgi:hypothetical protein